MAEIAPGFETLRKICADVLRGNPPPPASDSDFAAVGLALAERHRVVPLLAAGTPVEQRDRLRRRWLALAQQAVRREQELAAIFSVWSAANVPFLLLKGPGLARQGYPAPEWRIFDDLDLWVARRDLDTAVNSLEAAGYRRTSSLDKRIAEGAKRAGIEASLIHPEWGGLVEVVHGYRALAPTVSAAQEVVDSSMECWIGGAPIRIPAPGHALLMACVHGAHHRWDRLGWVADVAGLWRRFRPEERKIACATARRWRIQTMLGLGLRLAADHLELELDGEAAALASAPRVATLRSQVGLERIGSTTLRAPMMGRLRFERDAQDLAIQRWCLMARWIFQPTMGDIQAVPLPAAGYPLYAVIRPLRLFKHPWLTQWADPGPFSGA